MGYPPADLPIPDMFKNKCQFSAVSSRWCGFGGLFAPFSAASLAVGAAFVSRMPLFTGQRCQNAAMWLSSVGHVPTSRVPGTQLSFQQRGNAAKVYVFHDVWP